MIGQLESHFHHAIINRAVLLGLYIDIGLAGVGKDETAMNRIETHDRLLGAPRYSYRCFLFLSVCCSAAI
jgi:hypothetical protein